jgi:hypothetical protein
MSSITVVPKDTEWEIIKGDDFIRNIRILLTKDPVQPRDLTGYTIESEIRDKNDLDADLIATFVINVTDAEDGRFTVGLDKTITESIVQEVGFFDIKLTDGVDFTTTYIRGSINFANSVTKATD